SRAASRRQSRPAPQRASAARGQQRRKDSSLLYHPRFFTSTTLCQRQDACARRRDDAEQNDVDREIKQRAMPDPAIEAKGTQEPVDHDLKQKGDGGKDRERRKVHTIDIELANHDTLLTPTASLAPTCGASACAACFGRYSGAPG